MIPSYEMYAGELLSTSMCASMELEDVLLYGMYVVWRFVHSDEW